MTRLQRILAIETSNPTAADSGVAVGEIIAPEQTRILAVRRLEAGVRHDDQLVALIDEAMREAGLAPTDLDAVAVSVGPGGYTALRIAVSVGNMLGLATRAGLVAVPTASIAARSAAGAPRPLAVLLASKGDTAHVTLYGERRIDGDVRGVQTSSQILSLEVQAIVADEHAPHAVRTTAPRRGIALVPLRLSPEACLDVASLLSPTRNGVILPMYPRQPEAVVRWASRRA